MPKCCICGLQAAASQRYTVAMATAVPKLLKAQGGEKGGGEGTWAAFLEKTICFFPPSQAGVAGGWGARRRAGKKWASGVQRKKGDKRLQDAPRAAFLTSCGPLPFWGGKSLIRTKVKAGVGGSICAEPCIGYRVVPVTLVLGGAVLEGHLSATARFLLGSSDNLNGVRPHCVFLLLEDPERGESIVLAVEDC